ncbi:MAG: HDIG domain-containing protein [Armatimonadota bacterium]|nr:HDIG domain-containing protein [Armatimonadota bacterium]
MRTLDRIREATKSSEYEGRLYLVGGIVRDKILGLPEEQDIDIVLEGDAAALAEFLHDKGLTEHFPVVYPRFGTAMVSLNGRKVELVSARTEKYEPESRKPDVQLASLRDDALRRDFTINTLLENLHTGEVIDVLGTALSDLKNRTIRTPTDPVSTFAEDPLRMLRAVRFAARFGFTIDRDALEAIRQEGDRLSIVSGERIRDELIKILASQGAITGLELLRETGLLRRFAPEIDRMSGVTQNIYHVYDCWTHTLKALEALPPDASLRLRLATLFHDIGKPDTRTVDEAGNVHFYSHQTAGVEIARRVMRRLRFSNDEIGYVAPMIHMHLRVGEYDDEWSDAAVRRLIRDVGDMLDDLIELTRVDKAASNLEMPSVDLEALRRRIAQVESGLAAAEIRSPLNGHEIMQVLGVKPGPVLREAKDFLTNEVIEGRLRPGDKAEAERLLKERFG